MGREADVAAVEANEVAAHQAKYGKLEPQLFDLLADKPDDFMVKVGIRLAVDDPPVWSPSADDYRLLGEQGVEERFASESAAKRQRIRASEDGLVQYLNTMGLKILHLDELVPLVDVELPKTALAAIQDRQDVRLISMLQDHSPAMNVAAQTVHAHYVWDPFNYGFTGNGQKVAFIEEGSIVASNPYLTGRVTNRLNCPNPNPLSDYHPTRVAGVVGSNHTTYKGIAYQANLYGAATCNGFQSADLQAATLWAIIQGAQSHNNSWGTNSSGQATDMSRYQDDIVYDWRTTIVDAAGNQGTTHCPSASNPVVSPAVAYNVIAVGNFHDQNTYSAPSGWSDDAMSSSSCYGEPTSGHSDRKKPEVAAPGTSIMTTYINGITSSPGSSGTSFADMPPGNCTTLNCSPPAF